MAEQYDAAPPIDIHQLLRTMVERGASDLHLTVNSPPQLRIDGKLYPLRTPALTPPDVENIAYSVLNEKQRKRFEETSEIDLSFRWKGISRFRANFFRQQGSVAGALRMIPFQVKSLEELGIPPILKNVLDRPSGLVLVTGPTGSGKSTTLASMVDHINEHRRCHIITVEDPIEFLHQHKKSIVNQREVGTDTDSFKNALRYVLRQDPDVVLIGEIRDLESMEAALRISETGHIAFATLHTNSAVQTIHRILDFFPAHQQEMVRTQLSFVLEAILTQVLLPRKGGGRCLAAEILLPNAAIRNLIREEKTHQIYSLMQMGQGKHGMQTMNQAISRLVIRGLVAMEEAIPHSTDIEELEGLIQKELQAQQVAQAGQAGAADGRTAQARRAR
jgi:twitching motility protein PilT